MVSAGFLYPGYAAEDDYPYLEKVFRSSGTGKGDVRDVVLEVVHTSIGEDLHTVDALLETGRASRLAEGARRLSEVGSVLWACTSGSFVFGVDGAREQVERLAEVAGVPASSTSFAFVNALRALGVSRVSISATYPDDLASHFTSFLRDSGVEVVHWAGHDIMTAALASHLERDEVLALATAGDHPEAQAVLLPDTALHTARWLDELEAHVGKPVLTANQVTVWEGMRLAGDGTSRAGAGSLFRSVPHSPRGAGPRRENWSS